METKQYTTNSPGETRDRASRWYHTREGTSVLGLVGPLGAGKTTFIKGLVEAAGGDARLVRSPTFTLINEYSDTKQPVIHADLYRLAEGGNQETLGLEEYFCLEKGILVVEWANYWEGSWPSKTVSLELSYIDEDRRALEFTRRAPTYQPDRYEEIFNAGRSK